MRIVIIENQVIETILQRGAVDLLGREDRKVVILIIVPEGQGDNLGATRERRLNLLQEGLRDVLLHRVSARCGSAKATATMRKTCSAVASAPRASCAVTFRPW